MKYLISAAFATFVSVATPVVAQDNPVVVELYTSQGCSSCPPADKILHELADREDVIALALHVDYWDYIGWKDPFGNPAHAKRQRAYAQVAQRRTIYTPEMIVHGVTEIVGARPMKLSEAIAKHARMAPKVELDLERQGDELVISAKALTRLDGPARVYLLRYTPEHTTQIKRGENRGRTLSYANVVESWQDLGDWDGKGALNISAEMAGDLPGVVIIQGQDTGPILAAARLR